MFELNQKNIIINDLDKNKKYYKPIEFIGNIKISSININVIQKLKKMKMKHKQEYILMGNI